MVSHLLTHYLIHSVSVSALHIFALILTENTFKLMPSKYYLLILCSGSNMCARYRAPEVLLQSSTYTPAIGIPSLSSSSICRLLSPLLLQVWYLCPLKWVSCGLLPLISDFRSEPNLSIAGVEIQITKLIYMIFFFSKKKINKFQLLNFLLNSSDC